MYPQIIPRSFPRNTSCRFCNPLSSDIMRFSHHTKERTLNADAAFEILACEISHVLRLLCIISAKNQTFNIVRVIPEICKSSRRALHPLPPQQEVLENPCHILNSRVSANPLRGGKCGDGMYIF